MHDIVLGFFSFFFLPVNLLQQINATYFVCFQIGIIPRFNFPWKIPLIVSEIFVRARYKHGSAVLAVWPILVSLLLT